MLRLFAISVLLVSVLDHGLCYLSAEVFYVKPFSPTTECPSGDFPCHSLQYYANHSSFTNNSRFLFLEGVHTLYDTVVNVSNVRDLSLVGASESGVNIVCNNNAGFYLENFSGLEIGNLTFSYCSGYHGASVYLLTGVQASLHHISVSHHSGVIMAINVVDTFSISNSNFFTNDIILDIVYSECDIPSCFNFSDNQLKTPGSPTTLGLSIQLHCSNVLILIADSFFTDTTLSIDNTELTNNSVIVADTQFQTAGMEFRICSSACGDSSTCQGNYITFSNVSTTSYSHFTFNTLHNLIPRTNSCAIFIENSVFDTLALPVQFIYRIDVQDKIDINVKPVRAVLDNVTFANTRLMENSGAYLGFAVVLFINCTFKNNTGSAIAAAGSKMIFQGSNVFKSNYGSHGGAIRLTSTSYMYQLSHTHMLFEDNTGSAIVAISSKITFQGNTVFKSNSGSVGGAIQLTTTSYMSLLSHTHMLFEDNRADYVGGAIFVDNSYDDAAVKCFSPVDPSEEDIGTRFINNTAPVAGSSLYVGRNKCFPTVFNLSNTEADPSAFASDPVNICLCNKGKHFPACSGHDETYSTEAFPGQNFPIRLAVVGALDFVDKNGVVPGAIRAYVNASDRLAVRLSGYTQASDKPRCLDFNYSVNTREKRVTFGLAAEQSFFTVISANAQDGNTLYVSVDLKDCPLGFVLSNATGTCICDHVLSSDDRVRCYIDDQSILRPATSWIGFYDSSASETSGVIYHRNCPTGYCSPRGVKITINTSDSQCEPHRTGLVCGECKEGYSLTLSTQRCTKCSNTYLLLILPIAVLGLLFVGLLFTFNLTVTEGDINGLIFYANVIGMNYDVLFSEEKGHLGTFLAWLNLDLGIGTCLYDGMDGYAETWLEFMFPVYLWLIILVVVQLYRKFPRIANRLGGENAVKVLATTFLLSYTKLQRTVVTILSFTWLEYPDGVVRYVWLYDANVEFFKGKHLYLGIAGILVLVFLIVPYTLCLAFFQQLQACSGHRLFQWVNKLKPVFDAYAGPYKDKYRFWTGMLLVVRTLLIILFTINTAGSTDFNLLVILVVSFTLLMAHSNGTYKKWPYNYVESFFYLQLGVFAAGVAYAGHNHGNISAVADTSIGLSLAVFLAILGYHILCRFPKLKYRLQGYADIEEDAMLTHDRLIK